MSFKLFIGGLSYQATEEDIAAVFENVGEVISVKVITDRETGRSKGFAFVELASEEAGKKAIDTLNGVEIKGRAISVSEAKPKTDNNNRGSRRY